MTGKHTKLDKDKKMMNQEMRSKQASFKTQLKASAMVLEFFQ